MRRTLRLATVTLAAAALLVGMVNTVFADAGGKMLLNAQLAGLPASQTGTTLDGVLAGGKPWSIEQGSVQLFANGRLHVEVRGLVLTATGTNPFTQGQAILACDGSIAATSSPVPYSASGNARINEQIALPSQCLAPTVFFAGVHAPEPLWFAVTGW